MDDLYPERYKLKEKAAHIPAEISATLGLSEKEQAQLSALLEKLLSGLTK